MAREFFDTAELLLNHAAGQDTAWSNFGDWSQARDYPQACEALARRLADAAQLQGCDVVLDLGFGMGQQLALWRQAYAVQTLIGLNPSLSQCEEAERRGFARGYSLHTAEAEDWARCVGSARFDKILALDCAYHFRQREHLLAALAARLKPSGLIAWTDLHLAPGRANRVLHWQRRAVCAACRIPAENLMDLPSYQGALKAAGLELLQQQDLTADVLHGFARWWPEFARQRKLPWRRRLKYDLTAAALTLLEGRDGLRYSLFLAR